MENLGGGHGEVVYARIGIEILYATRAIEGFTVSV